MKAKSPPPHTHTHTPLLEVCLRTLTRRTLTLGPPSLHFSPQPPPSLKLTWPALDTTKANSSRKRCRARGCLPQSLPPRHRTGKSKPWKRQGARKERGGATCLHFQPAHTTPSTRPGDVNEVRDEVGLELEEVVPQLVHTLVARPHL